MTSLNNCCDEVSYSQKRICSWYVQYKYPQSQRKDERWKIILDIKKTFILCLCVMLFIGSHKLFAVNQITLLVFNDEDDAISIDERTVNCTIINLQNYENSCWHPFSFSNLTNKNYAYKCLQLRIFTNKCISWYRLWKSFIIGKIIGTLI